MALRPAMISRPSFSLRLSRQTKGDPTIGSRKVSGDEGTVDSRKSSASSLLVDSLTPPQFDDSLY